MFEAWEVFCVVAQVLSVRKYFVEYGTSLYFCIKVMNIYENMKIITAYLQNVLKVHSIDSAFIENKIQNFYNDYS